MVGSLNRAAYPPERSGVAEGELNAGCKSAAPYSASIGASLTQTL